MRVLKSMSVFLVVLFLFLSCREQAVVEKRSAVEVQMGAKTGSPLPRGEQKIMKLIGSDLEKVIHKLGEPCGDYFLVGPSDTSFRMVTFVLNQTENGVESVNVVMLLEDKFRTKITDQLVPTAELISPSTAAGVTVRLAKSDYEKAKGCLPPPNLIWAEQASAGLTERPLQDLSDKPVFPARESRCGKYLIRNGSKLECHVDGETPEGPAAITLLFEMSKFGIIVDDSKAVPTLETRVEDGKVVLILLRMSLKDYKEVRDCLGPIQEYVVSPEPDGRHKSRVTA